MEVGLLDLCGRWGYEGLMVMMCLRLWLLRWLHHLWLLLWLWMLQHLILCLLRMHHLLRLLLLLLLHYWSLVLV